jgi:hypothetical protein
VASSEHKSLRLGPVEFAEGEESASIHLEFDCAEIAGAEPSYCVIASGLGDETRTAVRLLGAWRKRAGVCRLFELPASAQFTGLAKPAQVASAASDSFTPVNE